MKRSRSQAPEPATATEHPDSRQSEPAGFSDLVGNLDWPMMVVTAQVGDERVGCLVGFGNQTSIHPPRFLVCLSRHNHTYRRLSGQRVPMAVHFLSPGDRPLAEIFGTETGDETDKFSRCAWHEGPDGAPILKGCDAWLVGRPLAELDLGDHVGFLLEPVAVGPGRVASQLSLRDVVGMTPGHEA